VVLAGAIAGCGGGGEVAGGSGTAASDGSAGARNDQASTTSNSEADAHLSQDASVRGLEIEVRMTSKAPPKIPGADHSIQEFGRPADADTERLMARTALTFLTARAVSDWESVCAVMGPSMDQLTAGLSSGGDSAGGTPRSCEQFWRATAAGMPSGKRQDQAQVVVGPVRVDGDRGFVLLKGERGWEALPMIHESGGWRVANINAFPLG
jgi:hypothetical protein